MENIDIKALARELKQSADNEEMGTVESKKVVPPSRKKPSKQAMPQRLTSLISAVNLRDDFMLKNDVYVDADVYDILRQLKGRTKLIIGNLASMLLEKFIVEHKAEIIRLLKKKSNRLLS